MMAALRIVSGARSDAGRRQANDDCALVEPELGLYAVCDGTSARVGGRTAAELACRALREDGRGILARHGSALGPGAEQLGEDLLQAAHQRIVAAQAHDPNLAGMTTTIVMVLHRGRDVLISHVGDSRAFLFRDPELRQLTRDHSLENYLKDHPEVRPKIKRPGKTLVRALGLDTNELGASHLRLELAAADTLLLCTDGVTDSLPHWTLREVLAGTSCIGAEETATCVLRAALTHGSMDNLSAVVLELTDRRALEQAGTLMYEVPSRETQTKTTTVLGWLAFLEGPRRGEVLSLEASTVIGAASGCRVRISEDYVSGRHAEILRTSHGFMLRDLGSTNGTFVNNVRTTELELADGDVVRIGKTAMTFKSHTVSVGAQTKA